MRMPKIAHRRSHVSFLNVRQPNFGTFDIYFPSFWNKKTFANHDFFSIHVAVPLPLPLFRGCIRRQLMKQLSSVLLRPLLKTAAAATWKTAHTYEEEEEEEEEEGKGENKVKTPRQLPPRPPLEKWEKRRSRLKKKILFAVVVNSTTGTESIFPFFGATWKKEFFGRVERFFPFFFHVNGGRAGVRIRKNLSLGELQQGRKAKGDYFIFRIHRPT